jgi:Tfp pilus assembly protein PilX
MGRSGIRAISELLALRRHARRHANWTLSVALISTLVTITLIALYLMQAAPELP